jgi:hypothetical protein
MVCAEYQTLANPFYDDVRQGGAMKFSSLDVLGYDINI